jgi:hypothetical protein
MFNKEELLTDICKAIKENHICFIADIPNYVPCSRMTIYNYFPSGTPDMERIEELLDREKIKLRVLIREKLMKNGDSKALLSLYRLVATPEERRALSTHYFETGEPAKPLTIHVINPHKQQTEE